MIESLKTTIQKFVELVTRKPVVVRVDDSNRGGGTRGRGPGSV